MTVRSSPPGIAVAVPGSRQGTDLRAALAEAAGCVREARQQEGGEGDHAAAADGCTAEGILVAAGFDTGVVQVVDLPGYGRSLTARAALPKGTVLNALPATAAALSAGTLRRGSSCAKLLERMQADPALRLAPRTELAILLMEAMAESESAHAVYFSSLPTHVPSPLVFQPAACETPLYPHLAAC